MKKLIIATAVAGLSVSIASAAVNTTFDFASAYVYRGTTWNDGAVFQPGIEASGFGLAESYGAVSAGAWGNYNFDNYAPGGAVSSEFSEADWYLSYSLPQFVEGLDLFGGYTEYTYPLGGTSDKEFNVGAGYEIAGVSMDAVGYFMTGGALKGQKYFEFLANYGLEITEELEATFGGSIGYMIQGDNVPVLDDGFNDASLDAGISYALSEQWSLGASLAYIAQLDSDVLPDSTAATAGHDVDFVAMFSLGCEM